jgi:hypothetical protein
MDADTTLQAVVLFMSAVAVGVLGRGGWLRQAFQISFFVLLGSLGLAGLLGLF